MPIPKARVRRRKQVTLTSDAPSQINPPTGCHFHTRCRYTMRRCRNDEPLLREILPRHWAACHLHDAGARLPPARMAD